MEITDHLREGVVLAGIINVKRWHGKWKKSDSSGCSNKPETDLLCHLPRDVFPVHLMEFDTNRPLCLSLFPAQTAIQHTVRITTRHKG